MTETAPQTLSKNIWELERRLEAGHKDLRTRLSLLKAYSLQIDELERRQSIPPQDRAFLKVCEDTQDGVLLIHGSTGSPGDLKALAEHLYDQGFSVYVMRLPGHGKEEDAMRDSTWRACLTTVETRYHVLSSTCRNVYVVGYSFGGTLAMLLNPEERPRALAMIAPAIHLKLRWWERLLLKVGILRASWVRKRLGWNAEVLEAMDEARKVNWWVRTPVLGAIASDDERVDPSSVRYLASRSRAEGTATYDHFTGGHGLMEGPRAHEIYELVGKFFKSH